MKNNKGITLIALVVTIIVLLILAGVSIAMLTGQNGILTKAGEARDNSAAGTLDEATKIAIGNIMTEDLRWKYTTDSTKYETDTNSANTNDSAALITRLSTEITSVNSNISLTGTGNSIAVDTTNADYIKIVGTVDSASANTKAQTVYVNINSGAVTTTAPAAPAGSGH